MPKEFSIIWNNTDEFVNIVRDIDLTTFTWNSARRFIVPKAELSYRVVTQLSPLDSIIFAALIYEIGEKIENKRIPISEKKVFTYRFCPNIDGQLYRKEIAWTQFWSQAIATAELFNYVTYLDIYDFYNQIYHHTIENQLIACGVENARIKVILNLLNTTTQRISRGVPIGPYPAHLLAEMSLIPIDESLTLRGYQFVRYADDYLIFTNSEQEAKATVYEFAEILDKEQRIIIQSLKTKLFTKDNFIFFAQAKVADQPLNNSEKEILDIVRNKTGNDLYAKVTIYSLSIAEMKIISEEKLTALLTSYLSEIDVDFIRIRWIYRRISQLRSPNLVNFSILNFERLLPAVSDVCHYLLSTCDSYVRDWKEIGSKALLLLELPIVKSNEYFQISILNLFSNNIKMNHFEKLLKIYRFSAESVRRKIILMADEVGAGSWIREQKENIGLMNDWTKRAYYIAMSKLPDEEKRFLIKSIKTALTTQNYLEHFILKHLD